MKYPTIAKLTGLNINTVKSFCKVHPVDAADTQPGAVAFCNECDRPVVIREKRKPRQFCSDACRMKWWNGHRTEFKEIYSEYYFEPMPDTLSCTVEGLAEGAEYTVKVVPLNVWLAEGDAITAELR